MPEQTFVAQIDGAIVPTMRSGLAGNRRKGTACNGRRPESAWCMRRAASTWPTPLLCREATARLRQAYRFRQGLPIGSGEIGNAHRYLVQKRLKLPGTWWLAANVEHVLILRLNRANGEWASYWATQYRYAA